MDYSTGQASHTGAYYGSEAEAEAEADHRNQKLAQQCADGLGMSLEEYEDSGEARNAEECYHVIEVR